MRQLLRDELLQLGLGQLLDQQPVEDEPRLLSRTRGDWLMQLWARLNRVLEAIACRLVPVGGLRVRIRTGHILLAR